VAAIFKVVMKETGMKEESIITKFRDLNPMHVGTMCKTHDL
jgi:hypothetical protein